MLPSALPPRRFTPRAALLAILVTSGSCCRLRPPPMPAAAEPAGCTRDVECKGSRICVAGRCVAPPASATEPAASLPAPASMSASQPATRPAGEGVVQFRVEPYHAARYTGVVSATEPAQLWAHAIGAPVFSSPAVAPDGTIYFGGFDERLHAVRPDGVEAWAFAAHDLVFSSPALLPNGLVLFGSDDDNLYALDARSGKVAWQLRVGSCEPRMGSGPEAARCDVDAGPAVAPSGVLYVGGDGVTAVDPDGHVRWTFRTPAHVDSTPAIAADGSLYFGCQDAVVYSLASDGSLRWQYRTGDEVDSSPAIASDGTVYVGSDDHKLYALTAAGALRWAVITGAEVESSPAIGGDGTVYVGSFDGRLYAVAPDGSVRWEVPTAGKIRSSPVLDGAGRVLVGSEDHRLYLVDPSGTVLWTHAFGLDVDSSAAIARDGTIYVGSDDGALHALR